MLRTSVGVKLNFSYIIETTVPFHDSALLSDHKYTALEVFIFISTLHTNIILNVNLNSEYFKHTDISHASHYIEKYFPARRAVKILRTVKGTQRT